MGFQQALKDFGRKGSPTGKPVSVQGKEPPKVPQEAPRVPTADDSGYQGPGSFSRLFEETDRQARKLHTGKPFTPQAADEMGRVNDELERLLKTGAEQEKSGDAGIHDTFRAFRRALERWYRLWEANEKGERR